MQLQWCSILVLCFQQNHFYWKFIEVLFGIFFCLLFFNFPENSLVCVFFVPKRAQGAHCRVYECSFWDSIRIYLLLVVEKIAILSIDLIGWCEKRSKKKQKHNTRIIYGANLFVPSLKYHVNCKRYITQNVMVHICLEGTHRQICFSPQ